MDWDDVRIFLALAREGSMRAAGRALGLSQPTIARRLAAFEATFGGPSLFDRLPEGLRLSTAGEQLVPAAESIEDAVLTLEGRRAARLGFRRSATADPGSRRGDAFPVSRLADDIAPRAGALAHAATVVLAAATARRLGGGKWAETVAALCVLTGGAFLGIGTTLLTSALEPLAGLFCAYSLIRIIRDNDRCWWLAKGCAAGIALQAKYLIAFWLAGLGFGLIATPARGSLLSPYIYGVSRLPR